MSDSPRFKAFSYKRSDAPSRIILRLNDQDIQCKGSVDGLTLLEFAGKTASATEDSSERSNANAAAAVIELLQTVIIDWDLFESIVKDEKSGIGTSELSEIAGWLVTQYVEERPTD